MYRPPYQQQPLGSNNNNPNANFNQTQQQNDQQSYYHQQNYHQQNYGQTGNFPQNSQQQPQGSYPQGQKTMTIGGQPVMVGGQPMPVGGMPLAATVGASPRQSPRIPPMKLPGQSSPVVQNAVPPNNGETSMPMIQFLQQFVVASGFGPAQKLPPSPTRAQVKSLVIQFLNSSRVGAKDVRVSEDVYGGSVWLSARGRRILENFIEMRRRSSSAVAIQKLWRGYRARKLVEQLRAGVISMDQIHAPVSMEPQRSPPQQYQQQQGAQPSSYTSGTLSEVSPPLSAATASPRNQAAPSPRIGEQQRSPGELRISSDDSIPNSPSMQHEQRKKKPSSIKKHLSRISVAYHEVLTKTDAQPNESSDKELQFMKLLNSEETFKLSANVNRLSKGGSRLSMITPEKRMSLAGDGSRTPVQMYADYNPKVVAWLGEVLKKDFPLDSDLVSLLRSGDLLCELCIAMYPTIQCQLLGRGSEFTVHKIIFFLELCKTVGLKPTILFTVYDLLIGPEDDPQCKSALTVLRTVCALERVARKKGWDGPALVLKSEKERSEKEKAERAERRERRKSREHGRSRSGPEGVASPRPNEQALGSPPTASATVDSTEQLGETSQVQQHTPYNANQQQKIGQPIVSGPVFDPATGRFSPANVEQSSNTGMLISSPVLNVGSPVRQPGNRDSSQSVASTVRYSSAPTEKAENESPTSGGGFGTSERRVSDVFSPSLAAAASAGVPQNIIPFSANAVAHPLLQQNPSQQGTLMSSPQQRQVSPGLTEFGVQQQSPNQQLYGANQLLYGGKQQLFSVNQQLYNQQPQGQQPQQPMDNQQPLGQQQQPQQPPQQQPNPQGSLQRRPSVPEDDDPYGLRAAIAGVMESTGYPYPSGAHLQLGADLPIPARDESLSRVHKVTHPLHNQMQQQQYDLQQPHQPIQGGSMTRQDAAAAAALLWQQEEERAKKQEEERKRQMSEEERQKQEQLDAERAQWRELVAMKHRRQALIWQFILNEEAYVRSLAAVAAFLAQLLKRRRRRTKRLSQRISTTLDTLTTQNPSDPESAAAAVASDVSAQQKAEAELEELTAMHNAMADMHSIHLEFLEEIREMHVTARRGGAPDSSTYFLPQVGTSLKQYVHDKRRSIGSADGTNSVDGSVDEPGRFDPDVPPAAMTMIGDSLLRVATLLQRPYITYAVVALSPALGRPVISGPTPPVDSDRAAFVLDVVKRFVGKTFMKAQQYTQHGSKISNDGSTGRGNGLRPSSRLSYVSDEGNDNSESSGGSSQLSALQRDIEAAAAAAASVGGLGSLSRGIFPNDKRSKRASASSMTSEEDGKEEDWSVHAKRPVVRLAKEYRKLLEELVTACSGVEIGDYALKREDRRIALAVIKMESVAGAICDRLEVEA
ncbi:hypothetical protein BJ742DRAFT_767623 [Cladochytrium replicatum]|nr:hypothetical protein BJ742DRAFT_767623 [Cladochytrium replicatum]